MFNNENVYGLQKKGIKEKQEINKTVVEKLKKKGRDKSREAMRQMRWQRLEELFVVSQIL